MHALTRVLPGTGSQSGSIHYEYTVSEEGRLRLFRYTCVFRLYLDCLLSDE